MGLSATLKKVVFFYAENRSFQGFSAKKIFKKYSLLLAFLLQLHYNVVIKGEKG